MISEKNLIGNVKEKKSNYDLMTAVMICLGKKASTDTNVLKLLNVLLSTETASEDKCQILEEDFKIKMTQTLESEVSLMCTHNKSIIAHRQAKQFISQIHGRNRKAPGGKS